MRPLPPRAAVLLFLTLMLATACGHADAVTDPFPPTPAAVAGGTVTTVAETTAGAPTPTAKEEAAAAPAPPATTAPPRMPAVPPPARVRELAPPALAARAAVVIDERGAVLFEKEAHEPLPPASTTKIMTALLALERGNLDDEVDVALDPTRAYWGSVMGLRSGDRFTLRDLLYGLMLPSGNDAAYVIATHIAGTESDFAEQMTGRMRDLGLLETTFQNASGLGRMGTNLASAHDLAQLARVAMANRDFATIVNTRSYTARGSRILGMSNGNGLLYAYPGADGVKIGWGGRFGGNTIVGTATRNGRRVYVALLDVPNRDGEAAALLNWAFTSYGSALPTP